MDGGDTHWRVHPFALGVIYLEHAVLSGHYQRREKPTLGSAGQHTSGTLCETSADQARNAPRNSDHIPLGLDWREVCSDDRGLRVETMGLSAGAVTPMLRVPPPEGLTLPSQSPRFPCPYQHPGCAADSPGAPDRDSHRGGGGTSGESGNLR